MGQADGSPVPFPERASLTSSKTTQLLVQMKSERAKGNATNERVIWEILCERIRPTFLDYMEYKMKSSHLEAEDIVQQILAELPEKAMQFQPGRARSWIHTCGVHVFLNAVQRHAEKHSSLSGVDPEETGDFLEQTFHKLVVTDLIEDVAAGRIEGLEPVDADIFRRHYADDEAMSFIAADLGMPLSTVYRRRAKMLELLRRNVEPFL